MFPKDTHILIVDDSANIRRIVLDSLRRMGYSRLTPAEDAVEAMTKLKASLKAGADFSVGLVLSDLNMPGPSGLDLLKELRSTEVFSSLPFILVTTESEKGAVIEAAAAGVSGYVVKPFNIETLTKKMKDAWKKHYPGSEA